jgi:predicted phage tail protein
VNNHSEASKEPLRQQERKTLKTILLYGQLGRQFGRVHRYDVRSPAEAVRAMCVTLKGFRAAINPNGAYRVLVGGHDGLCKERLAHPVSDKESIRIVPVIAGAGRGTGQVILGAVLIGIGLYFNVQPLVSYGLSMVIGGVTQMLFAPRTTEPGANDRPENRPSYTFDGAVNTAAQGNPVAIFYGGPLIIGSQVISAGLSVEQI